MTIIYLLNHSSSKLFNEVCSGYFSAFYTKKIVLGYFRYLETIEY
jgi:hypothetical protein